jgi:hypothetical protein
MLIKIEASVTGSMRLKFVRPAAKENSYLPKGAYLPKESNEIIFGRR